MEKAKVHVKKGDTVIVTAGRQRGQTGKVLVVMPRKQAVVVEGLNVVKRAVRPNPKNPQGGFTEKEAPMSASKVRPVCPKCGKPARVRRQLAQDGSKIRACAKCGGSLDAE